LTLSGIIPVLTAVRGSRPGSIGLAGSEPSDLLQGAHLLTGRIRDERGQAAAPTHTAKGARRYRYYVSRPEVRGPRPSRFARAAALAVRMMLPLAPLAPRIVRAIVDGRLPRGIGVRHLAGLPASWAEQERVLGL
jgi:hypothetical protein